MKAQTLSATLFPSQTGTALWRFSFAYWSVILLTFFCASQLLAQPAPPTNNVTPLDTWSFQNTNTWIDDWGDAPLSFTNISARPFGNGNAVVIDSTSNAWLHFAIYPAEGETNMTVNNGAVSLWFQPDWSSKSLGGTGPGGPYAALLETGLYTEEANVGWWSIYIDQAGSNIYFSAQTNNGTQASYLSSPIAWTNGGYHLIVLNYTPTNSQLYLDGSNMANGPGVTIYPSPSVLSNGLWIGSASNGISQCHGAISDVNTYDYTLSSNDIYGMYFLNSIFYHIVPQNIEHGDPEPEVTPTFNAVGGPGDLIVLSTNYGCGNSNVVWITNTTATLTNGAVNITFSIAGGSNGVPYDVFAAPEITSPLTNAPWSWLGQGYQCCSYEISDLTNSAVFLLLGTPQDSYGNGLTDAYELLVLHQNPANGSKSGDGMLDGWKVLWGMNPLINNSAQSSERENYTYDGTGRLEENSGVSFPGAGFSPELFGFDNEGNILTNQP
jgi:hypothetical protein